MENKTPPITEHQFHMVWTEAVGEEGYNKKLFQQLLENMKANGKIIPT